MGDFLHNVGLWIAYYWEQLRVWLLDATDPLHKFALMFVVMAAFALVMGGILYFVGGSRRMPRWAVLAGFVGPALLALGFGLVYPAVRTMWSSLYDHTSTNYVGFDNYVQAFTQNEFQLVLRNTLIWVVLVPLLSTGIGLIYAVLVDRTRFERVAKTLVFLPMAISMVGASIIWKFVYDYRAYALNPDGSEQNPQIGLLNQMIVWLRRALDGIGIHTGLEPQQILLNAPSNTLFLIIVMVWIQTGFAMTVLSASIKAIPGDIIEAARLDGLHGVKMFRYITIPSIRPAMVVVITTIAMATLKVFDVVRTMTGGNFQTSVVANEFYTQSFRQNNTGLGAALAVILFVMVIPIVFYNVRQMRLSEEIR